MLSISLSVIFSFVFYININECMQSEGTDVLAQVVIDLMA